MQSEYNCHVNTTLSVNEINRVNKIQSQKEKRESLWLERDSSLKAIDINKREKKGTRLRQNSFTILTQVVIPHRRVSLPHQCNLIFFSTCMSYCCRVYIIKNINSPTSSYIILYYRYQYSHTGSSKRKCSVS